MLRRSCSLQRSLCIEDGHRYLEQLVYMVGGQLRAGIYFISRPCGMRVAIKHEYVVDFDCVIDSSFGCARSLSSSLGL